MRGTGLLPFPLQTFEGIDKCGVRLADEIREVVGKQPQLRYISIMGHSLGGVIARYAAGVLYDSATARIGGLRPRHYISLASPHLGCNYEGPYGVGRASPGEYMDAG